MPRINIDRTIPTGVKKKKKKKKKETLRYVSIIIRKSRLPRQTTSVKEKEKEKKEMLPDRLMAVLRAIRRVFIPFLWEYECLFHRQPRFFLFKMDSLRISKIDVRLSLRKSFADNSIHLRTIFVRHFLWKVHTEKRARRKC